MKPLKYWPNKLLFMMILCSLIPSACESQSMPDARHVYSVEQTIVLAQAVQNGDIKQIRTLADQNANINAISDKKGLNMLIWALLNQQPEAMSTLLELGADPTLHTKSGSTVMHYAAMLANHPEYMRILLEHGAPVDVVDTRTGETPLFEALGEVTAKQFDMLLKAGADINHTLELGETPLHVAAAIGDLDSVLKLLKAGANPNFQDSEGNTFQVFLAIRPADSLLTDEAKKELEEIRQWLVKHDIEVQF